MPRISLTIEAYHVIAQEKGYTYVLKTIPKNTVTKIDGWRCRNGHVANLSYSNFKTRKSCPQCGNRHVKRRQDYVSLALSRGGQYLLNDIPAHTNDVAEDAWRCVQGHVWSASFTHISSAETWCPECARQQSRHTIEDYLEMGKRLGLVFAEASLPTNANKVCSWRCETHPNEMFSLSYHRLDALARTPCQHCGESTAVPGSITIDEAREIVRNVAKLKLADCHNILTRLCIDTGGTRDVLRRRIKDRLAEMISTGEKPCSESGDEPMVRSGKDEVNDKPNSPTSNTETPSGENRHDEESDPVEENESTALILREFDFSISVDKTGMVNATKLSSAIGERLDNYLASKQTKAFLKALEAIPEFQGTAFVVTKKGGKGGGGSTYFHRLVAYNYAQYMSGEFAAYVCHILDNYFLAGEVVVGKEKTATELETMWKQRYQQLETELEAQSTQIKKLKRSVARHERAHRFVKFGVEMPTYYAFSFGRLCSDGCRTKRLIKHGIAIKDKENSGTLDRRIRQHRITFRVLTPEFALSCPDARVIECIETLQEVQFGQFLNPSSGETFESVDVETLKKNAINLLNQYAPNKWIEVSAEILEQYNQDVENITKDGLDSDDE